MLSPFHLLRPSTVAEATAELDRLGDRARVYAGGAELLPLVRSGAVRPDFLIDIKRIPRLRELRLDGGRAVIGAAVTHRQLERSPLVRQHLPWFAAVESQLANIRVRNQGTLGGNLIFNTHADSATALLACDTTVRVAGRDGERELDLETFLRQLDDPGLGPDDLLVEIRATPLPAGWGTGYRRLERFPRPTINVSAAARRANGTLDEVRLAVGAIGPRARRLTALESRLRGLSPDEAAGLIRDSKRHLAEALEPVDDLYGSAAYKLHIVSIFLERALQQAARSAAGGPA